MSVVVPCYNGERFVASTLSSVIAQTMSDWRLVIVDDGSTDDSLAVIAAAAGGDERIRVISQTNGGVARARMAGLAESDNGSPFVIFLDADDIWEPDTLAVLIDALEHEPDEVVAVFGRERIIDGDDAPEEPYVPYGDRGFFHVEGGRVRRRPGNLELTSIDIATVCPITTPGECLIRRAALESSGATFDQTLSPCEDWDFWFQLSKVGTIKYLPRTVLAYRKHGTNASTQYSLMRRQRDNFYAKNRTAIAASGRTFQRLYGFGMYGHDVLLCLGWARDALRRREFRNSARLLARAARFEVRYLVERRR